MFVVLFVLMIAIFIEADFITLKTDLQKIIQLEDSISKIKYIRGEKISFNLMTTITQFDLFCDSQFPRQIITYGKALKCWNAIVMLWNKKTPILQYGEFVMIDGLLNNWSHLNQNYINLKVVLLEIIHSYVEFEKQLEILYNKYESKDKIIELMSKIE